MRIENASVENLEDVIKVTILVHMLLSYRREATIEDVRKYMVKPNELLFKATPLEVCMRGDADSLIKWLEDKLGI